MPTVIDLPQDPLCSPEATAKRLGVEVTTLATWRSKKLYPLNYVQVGRLIRYRRSDIENFLKQRTRSGVPEGGR